MAEPILTPYREEITRLYFARRESQAEIIRHLERVHGIRVNKGTLSRFLKSLPEAQQPPDGPQLSPDEEEFLAKAQVVVEVRARLDALLDLAAQTHARLEVLEDAAAERHAAVLRQIPPAAPVENAVVSPTVLLRIWQRAALVTGLAWGLVLCLGVLAWLWWSAPAPPPLAGTPPATPAPPGKSR